MFKQFQIGPNRSKLIKNDTKVAKMAKKGPKRTQIVKDCLKCLETVKKCQIGQKWSKMYQMF